jgi:AhpD family alkylhydroperoxidase
MRIAYTSVAPGAYNALLGVEQYVAESGLEPILLDLVRLRASQLNGCAFCLDMHSKDLRARGEDEQRLHLLAAWRDAPVYTERERAALAWTEAVTRLPDGGVPDAVYAEARRHFGDKALVDLTLAIAVINAWNRLNISFQTEVGGYQSPYQHRLAA